MLDKLFGFRPSEIAEIEGMKGSSSVRQLIIRVSDQLKTGEISLIESTLEDAEAAKARLDIVRERRRKHRTKNLEQGRAIGRERYARKKTQPTKPL